LGNHLEAHQFRLVEARSQPVQVDGSTPISRAQNS